MKIDIKEELFFDVDVIARNNRIIQIDFYFDAHDFVSLNEHGDIISGELLGERARQEDEIKRVQNILKKKKPKISAVAACAEIIDNCNLENVSFEDMSSMIKAFYDCDGFLSVVNFKKVMAAKCYEKIDRMGLDWRRK